MPPLESFAPLLVIGTIVAFHLAYYRRLARFKTKLVIHVVDHATEDFGETSNASLSKSALAGACRVSGDWVHLGRDGSVSPGPSQAFEDLSLRIAEGLGGRVFVRGDIRLQEGDFIDTLICMGDVVIDGSCTFLSPLKIAGDLTIEGQARFLKPVIVNGHTKVRGTAAFREGLISKGQTVVLGHMDVGAPQSEGWVVAQSLIMTGDADLKGHITTVTGRLPWAA